MLLRFDKDKKEWIQVSKEERIETDLYLDGKLKLKLDLAKKDIKRNNDVIGVVAGMEGSGKSSCAGNIMRYMTNDEFDPNKQMIGSDLNDAIDKITKAPIGGSLMFDEGNVFFLSTETMKREHRDLHKIFSIFRQKNLFVLIVLPSIFRLGTYFALDRSKFLIRTYMKDGKRGSFAFHGKKSKDKLYRYGKKEHNPQAVKPTFRGRFTACSTLENEKYKAFKLQTLNKAILEAKVNKKKQKTPIQSKRDRNKEIISNNPDLTSKELGKLLGLDDSQIRRIRRQMKDEE